MKIQTKKTTRYPIPSGLVRYAKARKKTRISIPGFSPLQPYPEKEDRQVNKNQ